MITKVLNLLANKYNNHMMTITSAQKHAIGAETIKQLIDEHGAVYVTWFRRPVLKLSEKPVKKPIKLSYRSFQHLTAWQLARMLKKSKKGYDITFWGEHLFYGRQYYG